MTDNQITSPPRPAPAFFMFHRKNGGLLAAI